MGRSGSGSNTEKAVVNPLGLREHQERPRLRVRVQPDGPTVDAEGTVMRIGSAKDNTLRLDDSLVSRRHLEIRIDEGGIALRDLESTNGTWIGACRVREAHVPDGTHVRVGETELHVSTAPEPLHVPLSRSVRFGGLRGRSVAMREAFALLSQAAGTHATVLIEGETGTGKELAAEALHARSPRAEGPFVVFDCSAVTPTLLQAELFGHVRGAFTGAERDRKGLFEEANGGTLFIDELGELPLELQPMLLRALESRRVKRVGSSDLRPVDVRIVAATNRELAAEVNAGRFRDDLYFRLSVVRIRLPALRERLEDVPLLVEHFIDELGLSDRVSSEDLLPALKGRAYPGNVRELRNAVERAAVLRSVSDGGQGFVAEPESDSKEPSDAELEPLLWLPFAEAERRWLDRFRRAYLARALEEQDGNVSAVARRTGVSRRFVQKEMRRLGVRRPGNGED